MAVAMGRRSTAEENARPTPLTVDLATRLGGTIIGAVAFGTALGGLVNPAAAYAGAAIGGIAGVVFAIVARKA